MSHVSTLKVEVTCLEALARAARRLGGELVLGQKTWTNYGSWAGDSPLPREWFESEDEYALVANATKDGQRVYMEGIMARCDCAIHFPDAAYEVGVVKRGDRYLLLADTWYCGGLDKVLGDGSALAVGYAAEAIKMDAELNGWAYDEWQNEKGETLVEVHC